MCWFYAMSRIPIAEVTAIGFTAPVFATMPHFFRRKSPVSANFSSSYWSAWGSNNHTARDRKYRIGCIADAYCGATFRYLRLDVKSTYKEGNGSGSGSLFINFCDAYNYDTCLVCLANT